MPRLPERYKTRWGYTAVAGFVGVLTALVAIVLLSLESSWPLALENALFGVIAVPAALLCWPSSSQRSVKRMIAAGILTVLVGFLLLGMLLAVIETAMRSDDSPLLHGLTGLPLDIVGFAILVSIITLGMPYVVGAVIAVLFAD